MANALNVVYSHVDLNTIKSSRNTKTKDSAVPAASLFRYHMQLCLSKSSKLGPAFPQCVAPLPLPWTHRR